MADLKAMRDRVLKERADGRIVFGGLPDELMTAKLDDFLKQPVDGILYDLNRSEEVVLTFLDDPKWVNDFAVATVIRRLVASLATSEAKLKEVGIEYDRLVERSVGAMAIAEGEEGYKKVRIDCPMLDAVLKLRMRLEKARELLTEIRPQVDMVRGSWFDRTDAFLASTEERT